MKSKKEIEDQIIELNIAEVSETACQICKESFPPDEIDIFDICEVCNGAIGNIFIAKSESFADEEE